MSLRIKKGKQECKWRPRRMAEEKNPRVILPKDGGKSCVNFFKCPHFPLCEWHVFEISNRTKPGAGDLTRGWERKECLVTLSFALWYKDGKFLRWKQWFQKENIETDERLPGDRNGTKSGLQGYKEKHLVFLSTHSSVTTLSISLWHQVCRGFLPHQAIL